MRHLQTSRLSKREGVSIGIIDYSVLMIQSSVVHSTSLLFINLFFIFNNIYWTSATERKVMGGTRQCEQVINIKRSVNERLEK